MIEDKDKARIMDRLTRQADSIFSQGQNLVMQEFSFYSFAVTINVEQQKELMQQFYPSFLEAQLFELEQKYDEQIGEIESVRKMKADFTKSQESAQKTINDLKAKVELKDKQIQEMKKQHEE